MKQRYRQEVQRPLLVVTECKMVRDAVPLLLPLSQGRLSAHLALVLPLQPLQHRHRLSPHLRQTWRPAVRVVCDSIQSKVVPELSALQQTNQTEIFSSATTSFNFLYKVYHKTGRTLSLALPSHLSLT